MFLRKVSLLKDQISTFSRYPFSIPAINNLDTIDFHEKVTFFAGENGSGKSTLLEAIADKCEFNTAGGSRNNLYDVHAAESSLSPYIRLSWLPKINQGFFLRAETFYQFASHIDELDHFESYGHRSLHEQSHGESFLTLFKNRFNGRGIYLLDEPEAALSPARQLAFLRLLHDMDNEGDSQFIIATHSPILLGYPNAIIYEFDDQIRPVTYEETAHYNITRRFLEQRKRYLKEIFED